MTIEERASEYARNGEEWAAYWKGAKEQRNIDIEKACKWLAENADDYSRSSLTDINRYLWVDPHMIEDFRKAMEGGEE